MALLSHWRKLAGGSACIAGCLLQTVTPVSAADLALEARRIVGAGQGVQVETQTGRILVSEAGARAVHPASVSKLPTTLALLRELGPDYRFATAFLAGGPMQTDTIDGPLVVRANGDPYFVDENALLVAEALRRIGLHNVSGGLVVEGHLLFNWKADDSAARLRHALEGNTPAAAWAAVRVTKTAANTEVPRLQFDQLPTSAAGFKTTLVTHLSQPLRYTLKALNGYSNNIFAPFADAAGGIASVQEQVRVNLPPGYSEELVLGDGAGAHVANRMSPRVTVAILRALETELGKHGLDLTSVMPVAGIDEGTLKERFVDPQGEGFVVAKTGTYGDYGACALAGALRTRNGIVYFAILNRGVAIAEARRRQDAYVRVLMAELGALPWDYQRIDEPAFMRAEVMIDNMPGFTGDEFR
ncbi:D-alanyl-D-alanine carboxypeptidase DacB [Halioglobus japonicus]|nr:D-alanyl-D-alanine carboxypeptidase DacB [Halioglobus japonicus]